MLAKLLTELNRHVFGFLIGQLELRVGQASATGAVLNALAPVLADFAAVVIVEGNAFDHNGKLHPRLRARLDDEVLKALDKLGLVKEY